MRSAIAFSYKRNEVVAIWQRVRRHLGTFLLRMRSRTYLGASGQKSDPTIRSSDLDFLW